jgi:hypothetical protein
MTSAAIQVPALVIGPQSAGRGYRVLSRSDGRAIPAKANSRISELALVLAGWADEREPHAAALIPLTERDGLWLLMRAAYLGSAPLGTVAFAHGVILDGEAVRAVGGRPENLLEAIPVPDGSLDFGETPARLAVDRSAPPRRDWSRLGLEWLDRVVAVDAEADVVPMLRSILSDSMPIGAGGRVRGWATSALFPQNGGFSAQDAFQLIVTGPGRRAPGLRHLNARVTEKGWEGDRVEGSAATRTWERLRRLAALDPALEQGTRTLHWTQSYFGLEPAELLRQWGQGALRPLPGAARMRLILEMARPQGDDLDADFAGAARSLFEWLLGQPDLEPQHAAYYIKCLAEGPRDAVAALGDIGASLVMAGTGSWLRGETLGRLLELGYADALARQPADPASCLDGLGQEDLAGIVQDLITRARPSDEHLELLATLLPLLCGTEGKDHGRPAWAAAFEPALALCLQRGPADSLSRLASRDIVLATARFGRPRFANVAAKVLSLRDVAPGRPDEFKAMLGASLAWVKVAGAAS